MARKRTKQELAALRKKLGWSVKDCCEKSGVPIGTWSKWEIPSTPHNPQPVAHAWLEALIEIESLKKELDLARSFIKGPAF